jgi:transcription initiation factor TFIID subunit 6
MFEVEDRETSFQDILSAPLPKAPRDVSLTAHWLSVEGVVPPIPQNLNQTQMDEFLAEDTTKKSEQ